MTVAAKDQDKPADHGVVAADEGAGPLLERDYRLAVDDASCTPEQAAQAIRARFPDFAPPDTAVFHKEQGPGRPLAVGDEMEIDLAMQGRCRVVVVQADDRRLTLRTLAGHPEAGRITFGAGRDGQGRLVLRICSRARVNGWLRLAGFWLIGKQLQARCWIRFLESQAQSCGGRPAGPVRVTTRKVAETPADRGEADAPTFDDAAGES